MAIRPNKSPKKGNYKAALLTIAKYAIGLADKDAVTAFDTLLKAVGALNETHPTIEQRVWDWWRETVAVALAEAIRTPRALSPLTGEEVEKAVAAFLGKAFEPGGHELTTAHLIAPASAPICKPLRDGFPKLLSQTAPEHRYDDEEARRLFDRALEAAAMRVYTARLDHYKPLVDALDGPVATGDRRRLAWGRHADWIRGLYYREPIFNQDEDTGLSLSKVYVPLRCYHHEIIEDEEENPATRHVDKKERTAHLDWLHGKTHAWLDADRKTASPLRIVAGGPGSGKSSFAKALACEVLEKGAYHVIFVPLQHMMLSADPHADLNKFLVRRWNEVHPEGGQGFPENPLDWAAQDDLPILIVFDGLDELAKSEDRAEDLTRRFVSHIDTALKSDWSNARALILGRSVAAEAARVEADLPMDILLHALPLRPIQGSDLSGPSEVHDPKQLMEKDDRPRFWTCWHRASGTGPEDPPSGVTADVLSDLNGEPLLLYLLILSGYATTNFELAANNRNLVYQAIFERVFERNKKKEHIAAAGIDRADFFNLMECLGLAAWAGGGRVGDDDAFIAKRDLHAPRKHRKRYRNLAAADLKNVAVQFYTRADTGDDPGFEFIHKSFGEYLAARGIFQFAHRQNQRLADDEIDESEFAAEWQQLVGNAEITSEIITFTRNEARFLGSAEALAVKDRLTDVFSLTLRDGFPAHERPGSSSWRELETYQRCAETALLAVLNALALSLLNNEFDGEHNVALIRPKGVGRNELRSFFDRLKVTSEFPASNLFGCLNLQDANIFAFNLIGANLTWVDLAGANLSFATLLFADLSNANLSNAELYQANLIEADLCNANLSGAELENANLSDANLSGANLSDANLSGADLSDANLSRVDLRNVELNEANLSGAELSDANLSGANLIEVRNLSQFQIDQAKGNSETVLPDELTRPVGWEKKED